MPEAGKDRLTVRCDCGAELKVSAEMAGKRGRCPTCREVFTIPEVAAVAPVAASSDELADEEDDHSLLDDLAAMERSQPANASQTARQGSSRCDHCGKDIADDAVICVHCGFNRQSGKTLKAARAKKAVLGGIKKKLSSGAGTFVLGCVFSGMGALIGAAIWAGVAIATEYEIGYIAWGLGVLAGLGMLMGCQEGSLRAGLAASVIALVGIVGAKATTFIYLNYAEIGEVRDVVTSFGDELAEERGRLAGHQAHLRELEGGFVPFGQPTESAYEAAYLEIVKYSPEQIRAEVAELDRWEKDGKWSDTSYVRNYLIYERTKEALVAANEASGNGDSIFFGDIDANQWRTLRRAEVAEVEQLSSDEQFLQAKEIEADVKRVENIARLADHEVMLVSLTVPPSESESLSLDFYDERVSHYEESDQASFDEAVANLDAWEKGGKWDDTEFVQNQMINDQINEAIGKRNEDLGDDDDYWSPSDEEWKTMHDSAQDEVNMLTHEQRVAESQKAIEEQKQRIAEMIARYKKESMDEAAGEATSHAFSFFVENYFGAMDLLFVALAVGSAFKIALAGNDD